MDTTTPVPVFTPRREADVLLPERTTRLMHMAYDWRIWWIPAVPGEPVYFECPTPETAVRLLDAISLYDLWLTDQRIMGDWTNAGGIQRWQPSGPQVHGDSGTLRSVRGEWVDVEWDEATKEWID